MAQAVAAGRHEHQQHPIKVYFIVWGWLFVLSTFSYLVDYFHLVGYLRWSLILLFMILKAGLIVAVFMPMALECRSEERLIGKEGVSTCRSRLSTDHSKK